MCHADLEICLIESRVSETRDLSNNIYLIKSRVFETRDSTTCIKNAYLIESRVFETRDSIKQPRPYIQATVSRSSSPI